MIVCACICLCLEGKRIFKKDINRKLSRNNNWRKHFNSIIYYNSILQQSQKKTKRYNLKKMFAGRLSGVHTPEDSCENAAINFFFILLFFLLFTLQTRAAWRMRLRCICSSSSCKQNSIRGISICVYLYIYIYI